MPLSSLTWTRGLDAEHAGRARPASSRKPSRQTATSARACERDVELVRGQRAHHEERHVGGVHAQLGRLGRGRDASRVAPPRSAAAAQAAAPWP